MKRIICCCLAVLLISFYPQINVDAIEISAKSAVLMDPVTKRVLYEKNPHEKMAMASTTKLMTALLLSEYIDENGDTTVSVLKEAVMVEGSSMGLHEGDKISLSGLLVGMLLPSGNDTANMAAFVVAGNLEKFAVLMNQKATELGMLNTSFVTPSGLDSEKHYSTSYDMALLMSECLLDSKLRDVMSQETIAVTYYCKAKDSEIKVSYDNHNKLLSLYDYCDGGKTGYTKKSGRTLATSATKDNCVLVAVTFNASDDWNDHIKMFDYGFSQVKQSMFSQRDIILPTAEGEPIIVKTNPVQINNVFENQIEVKTILPRFIYANAYEIGEKVGEVRYYIDKMLIYTDEIYR